MLLFKLHRVGRSNMPSPSDLGERNGRHERHERHERMVVFGVVFVVAACAFLLELRIGFNLWDEGYLWYGVQRTLLGEVPLRDFMSYDPGRYYFAAAWLTLFHTHGIVAVRFATAAFAAAGVALGASFVGSHVKEGRLNALYFSVAATTLSLLWMVPWWKQYDEAVSIVLVVSLAHALSAPHTHRTFVHGIVVGLCALIGRNHGFYGAFACVLAMPFLIAFTGWANSFRWTLTLAAGALVGFSPLLIALCVDHCFARMFWESVRFMLFEYKGTNLPLPVPWPWRVPLTGNVMDWGRSWLTGCMYVGMPLFCLAAVAIIARTSWQDRKLAHPAFAACVLTAMPYMTVAFSRADLQHLAQAIFPFLLGALLWPSRTDARQTVQRAFACLLVLLSFWIVLPIHPFYSRYHQGDWQKVAVGRDMLWMSNETAASVRNIKYLAALYVPEGGTVLSIPVWPGVYALLHTKSPVYEIYPLFPRNRVFQLQEMARLEKANPALVLFNDVAVDGRDDLRYASTHPLLVDYIRSHYRFLPDAAKESALKVYVSH